MKEAYNMGALELSRDYFLKVARPALERDCADVYPRLAAGLVGNGSDRYGFDDEISRDHDWGVDFYLWTTEEDAGSIGALNEWKRRLFAEHPPSSVAQRSQYCLEVNAMTVADFYRQLIGTPDRPQTLGEWIRVGDENFSLATNGEVFLDGAGEFSAIRARLLEYYPEDLRRKRIAAKCMEVAQSGQYNHLRMARRADWVATRTTLTRFTEATIALVFLLNRVYRPYYKWEFRMMRSLPILGEALAEPLERLALSPGFGEAELRAQSEDVELICAALVAELHAQGLARSHESFLTAQGAEVQASISSEGLRAMPAQHWI
ncbi:MAG: DUF4037 domain-containing protein [Coriobacteriales bacterium]|jgi:hypothetical protein|nr:DUF4037 domain-containing protein [Coriobacteriales bacterium]